MLAQFILILNMEITIYFSLPTPERLNERVIYLETNFAGIANVEKTKMFSGAMSSEEVVKQSYGALMKAKEVKPGLIPGFLFLVKQRGVIVLNFKFPNRLL